MSAFESHYDVGRHNRTEQRGVSESVFQNERLAEGRNFECNLSAASDKLARDGVLPNVEIEGDKRSHRDNIFNKFDGDKNGKISGKEWSTKFDNLAGDDQQARLKDFKGEFGDNKYTTRLFERADKDHDKIVSAPEFLDLYDRGERDNDRNELLGRREFRRLTGRHWNDDGAGGGDGPKDSPYQPKPPFDRQDPPVNRPEPPVDRPQPPVVPPIGRPDPPVARPAPPSDRPSPPIDQPIDRPTVPTDNGEIPRATPAQVEQLFSRIENRGASDRYMQEIKQALGQLPASVVQAAIDGRTRIVAVGQGPRGLGGTYNSATNSITMFETSPFNTKATLAAEMFHNWDLNPFVGKHVSSQPWFQNAFQRARASGIFTGDNTFSNRFEFIHHMARYYSGITGGVDGQLMNFLGPDYRARSRQALLS